LKYYINLMMLVSVIIFMTSSYADTFSSTSITSTSSTSPYAITENVFKNTSGQYLTGQCTWYVYGRVIELVSKGELDKSEKTRFYNAFWDKTLRHAKNWNNQEFLAGKWYCTQREVLPVEHRQKGLIAVWEGNLNNSDKNDDYGHVGFVEEVSADKKLYRLSDFNRGGHTTYRNKWYRFDSSDTSVDGLDDILSGQYPCFQVLKLNDNSQPQLGDIYNDYKNISISEIQNFLEHFSGDLKNEFLYNYFDMDSNNFYQEIPDWNLLEFANGVFKMSPAEIIYYSAKENNINPVLLLTKIQQEQSLISQSATQHKLNRATGYGIPNSNPDGDPKYRSFLAQLTGLTYQFDLFRGRGLSFRDAYDTYTVDNTGQDASFSSFMELYESYAVLMDNLLVSFTNNEIGTTSCTNEQFEPGGKSEGQTVRDYQKYGLIRPDISYCHIDNRYEFIAILTRALEHQSLGNKGELDDSNQSGFNDTAEIEKHGREVYKADNLGIISPNATFDSEREITRIEALAFSVRTYEHYCGEITLNKQFADNGSGWEKDIMDKGYGQNLTSGYEIDGLRYFKPNIDVPRVDSVAFVNKLIQQLETCKIRSLIGIEITAPTFSVKAGTCQEFDAVAS